MSPLPIIASHPIIGLTAAIPIMAAAIHHTAAGHYNIRADAHPAPLRPPIPLGERQPPSPIWPLFRLPSNDAPQCYYYVCRHRHRHAGAHHNVPSNGQPRPQLNLPTSHYDR
ncbi:Hypothetical predicted protein [Pelobates cultripes]|uniref:Uncharacterized protein n=1 Tax=Pelobates cultripes TaxID=61616 RepID=A0AAD1S6N4_PELCU|nr:Hypothetical predicted protein [Pelobates cultripes]